MRKRKTCIDCGKPISPSSLYRCLACQLIYLKKPKQEHKPQIVFMPKALENSYEELRLPKKEKDNG